VNIFRGSYRREQAAPRPLACLTEKATPHFSRKPKITLKNVPFSLRIRPFLIRICPFPSEMQVFYPKRAKKNGWVRSNLVLSCYLVCFVNVPGTRERLGPALSAFGF
jgi:hypothetical protein